MPRPSMGKVGAESRSGWPQPTPRPVIKKLLQLTQAAQLSFSWMSWDNGKDACSHLVHPLDVPGYLEIAQ